MNHQQDDRTGEGEARSVLDDFRSGSVDGVVQVPFDLRDDAVSPFLRARKHVLKAGDIPAPSTYIVKPDPKPEPIAAGRVRITLKKPTQDLGELIRNAMAANWFGKQRTRHHEEVEEEEDLEPSISLDEFDARRELDLTLQDLATWIRHPDFKKLVCEDVAVERYKHKLEPLRIEIQTFEDGGTFTKVPPTKGDRRKMGRYVRFSTTIEIPKKRVLQDKERRMYLDLAGNKLSAEEMLKKHGPWADKQIRSLEAKVICHAIDVGLYQLPLKHQDSETGDRFSALSDAIRRGQLKGLSFHNAKRSFDRGPVHMGGPLTAAEKYAQRMGPPEGTDGDDS